MRRFTLAVFAYCGVCLGIIIVIVLHGDGPHPAITATIPANGSRFWPGGVAEITFSQEMDQTSVERALQSRPGTQGSGVWTGNTLNLQPVGDWQPETTYQISLDGTVTDTAGRPLRTPFIFWFHVHRVGAIVRCRFNGLATACDGSGRRLRPLLKSPFPILEWALSPDRSQLAFTRPDATGAPHLFVLNLATGRARQLTRGTVYSDRRPYWNAGFSDNITYQRLPRRLRPGGRVILGSRQFWNIGTDGSGNSRLPP